MVGVVQQTAFVDDLLTIKTTPPQEERRSGNPHFGILESRDRRHRSISDLNVGRQQSVAPRRSNGRLAQCGARRRSKGDEIGSYVQRTTCVAPTWETGCRTKAGERWEGQAEDRPGPDAPVLGGIRLGASEKRGNKRTGADREGRGGGSRQDPGRFQTVRSLDRPLSGPQGSRAPAGRALQAPSGISMESHAGSGGPGRYDHGRRRRKERRARRDAEDVEEDRRRASPPWASGPTTERQWNPNPRPPCRFFALFATLISASHANTSRLGSTRARVIHGADTTRHGRRACCLTDLGSSCNIHARCSCCDATMAPKAGLGTPDGHWQQAIREHHPRGTSPFPRAEAASVPSAARIWQVMTGDRVFFVPRLEPPSRLLQRRRHHHQPSYPDILNLNCRACDVKTNPRTSGAAPCSERAEHPPLETEGGGGGALRCKGRPAGTRRRGRRRQ